MVQKDNNITIFPAYKNKLKNQVTSLDDIMDMLVELRKVHCAIKNTETELQSRYRELGQAIDRYISGKDD